MRGKDIKDMLPSELGGYRITTTKRSKSQALVTLLSAAGSAATIGTAIYQRIRSMADPIGHAIAQLETWSASHSESQMQPQVRQALTELRQLKRQEPYRSATDAESLLDSMRASIKAEFGDSELGKEAKGLVDSFTEQIRDIRKRHSSDATRPDAQRPFAGSASAAGSAR